MTYIADNQSFIPHPTGKYRAKDLNRRGRGGVLRVCTRPKGVNKLVEFQPLRRSPLDRGREEARRIPPLVAYRMLSRQGVTGRHTQARGGVAYLPLWFRPSDINTSTHKHINTFPKESLWGNT